MIGDKMNILPLLVEQVYKDLMKEVFTDSAMSSITAHIEVVRRILALLGYKDEE